MILLLVFTVLITLVVLALLLRPLLRAHPVPDVSPQRLNLTVYRDQLEALERELAAGQLGQAEYQAAREELELRLLDDERSPDSTTPAASARLWSARRTAWVLALVVPLSAAGLYAWLGAPLAVDWLAAEKAEMEKVNAMVQELADRLKADPNNAKGWAMLARSYKALGRLSQAEDAYLKAGPLMERDADLLTGYAELLAARADEQLQGRPMELVNKALAIDPMHPMGLMLSGTAAYREGNFASAVGQWDKLLTLLEPGSQVAEQLRADIAEARSRLGAGPAAASSAPAGAASAAPSAAAAPNQGQIQQMVERLAERLKSNPDDLAGWARLGRSYKVLGRLEEAEAAYGRASKLVDTNPDMLADFADLLATRAGGNFEGRPAALLAKAAGLDARHPMTLMLLGTAAYRRGDFSGAVTHWEKLQAAVDPQSAEAAWAKTSLADARARLVVKKP